MGVMLKLSLDILRTPVVIVDGERTASNASGCKGPSCKGPSSISTYYVVRLQADRVLDLPHRTMDI